MKIDNIKNMSNKELYTFINQVSNNNGRVCCKCGKIVYKEERVTLNRTIGITNKKICCLCKVFYSDLLDFLEVCDYE